MTAKSIYSVNDGVVGYNEQVALITSILNKATFTTLVQIVNVYLPNAESNNYIGTVDVKPLIHQIDGHQNPIEHGVIYGLGYIRIQGGLNALIIDPQIGDIGLCVFCNNDISKVKATKAPALPGSSRRNDWADGIYIGGLLNGIPLRYIKISDLNGIDIISTNNVTITSPQTTINGAVQVNGTLTASVEVIANGTHLHTHTHNGVTTGSGNTGAPN
jgi:hypothetical protein